MVVVDLPAKGGFTGQAVAVAEGLIPGLVAGHYGLTTGLDAVALLHPDREIPTVAAKAEVAVVVRHRTRVEVACIQYHDGRAFSGKSNSVSVIKRTSQRRFNPSADPQHG